MIRKRLSRWLSVTVPPGGNAEEEEEHHGNRFDFVVADTEDGTEAHTHTVFTRPEHER